MSDEHRPAVWVDPGRQGGNPCVMGTRIPTEAVAGVVWTHGVAEAVTMWPHLTEDDVRIACWYEATHARGRKWRQRWGAWAQRWHESMWRSQYGDVPDPPTKADEDDQP